MQIPVLVERIAGNGYRARGAQPFEVVADGASRDEAVAKVRDQIQARLAAGAELVSVEIGPQPNPWVEFAGMFKDDPLIEDWKKSMAEYRDQVEQNPDRP